MQQGLKINPHGVVGVVFIVLMFGIAFFLNWNINWWYFSIAVLLYSVAVISLANTEADYRWLLGCHLALLFWAVGLLLHFQDYTTRDIFGITWVYPGGLFIAAYFIASALGGLALPFLVLRSQGILHVHGLVALLLIIIMFGIAFLYNWNLDRVYLAYLFAAITLYTPACLLLNHLTDNARRYGDESQLNRPFTKRSEPACLNKSSVF